MNGTRFIIEGDNAKVHAWFTEHDRLHECHCDACSAERTAAYFARMRKYALEEKIYSVTQLVAGFLIPITIIAGVTLAVMPGHPLAASMTAFGLAVEILATVIICAKTNPYK